jgi:hypothetical protein
MEKLAFREIENRIETELFIEKFEVSAGVRLPLDYVENSQVIGAFLHDKLVAGYMIVTESGYRSLMFVPDSVKKSDEFFKNSQNDMLEVNGLWIGPTLKSPLQQFRVWLHLAMTVITSRKEYVLLMSNSKNKNIQFLHGLLDPVLIYEGSPNLMVGDESHETIRVGFTTPWTIVLNAPRYLKEVWRRQQRARGFSQKQTYSRSLKHSKSEFA